MPVIPLNDGTTIPQVGYGVFEIPAEQTRALCRTALDAGYRHIDTARFYGNEEAVGQAVRDSGLDRDAVHVTSKVWNNDHGYDAATAAIEGSVARLGIGALDLMLIHWPMPVLDAYVDTWRALIDARDRGLVRSIGVSNFHENHLHRIIDETGVVPAVNQIESHPYLQQRDLRAVNAGLGIVTQAWSPLARGREVLDDEVITSIADRHQRTPAQVVLRWHVELGTVVLPRSTDAGRIAANLDLFGFTLDDDDHTAIRGLERGLRVGPDPDTQTRVTD